MEFENFAPNAGQNGVHMPHNWSYLDKKGRVQGPFTAEQMRSW